MEIKINVIRIYKKYKDIIVRRIKHTYRVSRQSLPKKNLS